MHDMKTSISKYLLDQTAVGHARRHFHLGIAKQAWRYLQASRALYGWMPLGAKELAT